MITVLNKIREILSRGNTAEVKKVKEGIVVLEVHKKIRYTEDGTELKNENQGEVVERTIKKRLSDDEFNDGVEN